MIFDHRVWITAPYCSETFYSRAENQRAILLRAEID